MLFLVVFYKIEDREERALLNGWYFDLCTSISDKGLTVLAAAAFFGGAHTQ